MNKRTAEGNAHERQGAMPTLGQVLEKAKVEENDRFALLHELLHLVADTPVDQLSEELRNVLRKKGGEELEMVLAAFFAACDAETRKRPRVESGNGEGSSDGPVKIPEPAERDILFGAGNILDQIFAAALLKKFSMDGLVLVEPTVMQPAGVKIPLPASVNAEIQPYIDLRLPHKNPLIGTEGPLHDMRDDVLSVIDGPAFGHVMLIGSTGCGKTSTAFLIAKERYCVFVECFAGEDARVPYLINADALKKPRGDKQLETIKRRLTVEVLARFVLLAILHKVRNISPYQWLLLSISDNAVFCEMLRKLKEVFNGTVSGDVFGSVMAAVETELKFRPSLIIDEAHLLVERERTVQFTSGSGESERADTFGGAVITLSHWRACFASCVWIGTQVSLEQCARLATTAFKTDGQIVVYAFCSFPLVTAKRVALLSKTVLGNGFEFASNVLRGRPRQVAALICIRAGSPKEAPVKVVKDVLMSNSLVQEMRRVIDGVNFNEDSLLDLWMAAISFDENGATVAPPRHGGTLPFTKCFAEGLDWGMFAGYKTGGLVRRSVLSGEREQLSFKHVLEEPALLHAIERYFLERQGEAPYQRLFCRARDKCLSFEGEPSIRGQLLDVAFLCNAVSKGETTLSKWLPLENSCFEVVREATFKVTRIVSGKGVFYRWLEAVLRRPEVDFLPGVAARNVCVRPEILAGADGAFAAFLGGKIVIVTVACAWYTGGVIKEKWCDQADRSSRLLKQFMTKKEAKKEVKVPKDKKVKVPKDKNGIITKLVNATNPLTLRILVELPKRQGTLPSDNVQDGALVVDARNVGRILGEKVEQSC